MKIVVAIIIVGVALTTGILMMTLNDTYEKDVLQSGDVLYYSIVERNNGTAKTYFGYAELPSYDEGGYLMTGSSPGFLDLPSGINKALEPSTRFLTSSDGLGSFMGNHQIMTPFGEKCVSTYISANSGYIILREVGQETSIIYRKVILNENYQLTYTLNGTYNEDIWYADQTYHSQDLNSFFTTGGDGDGIRTNMVSGTCSFIYGALRVGEGDEVKYYAEGEDLSVYFLRLDQLGKMETAGVITFVPGISTFSGTPRNISMSVAPGDYFFLAIADRPTSDSMIWLHFV